MDITAHELFEGIGRRAVMIEQLQAENAQLREQVAKLDAELARLTEATPQAEATPPASE